MIPIIGMASGLGAGMGGCSEGPKAIQESTLSGVEWKNIFHPQLKISDKKSEIIALNKKLATEVYSSVLENPFTMVIGGDHSCAIGTWSGVAEALRSQGEDLALLWLDAHMDSHTPETTPSGNIHGMPLATLLGCGSEQLTELLSPQPKLKPENVFLIGIRSYEEAEKDFVERHNIRVYYIEEVHERGLETIFTEIIEHLEARKLSYGLTVDIDFFEPEEMSATGTPEKDGIHPQEFLDNYAIFERHLPVAFEFVEFNPSRDRERQSLNWTVKILERALEASALVSKEALVEAN